MVVDASWANSVRCARKVWNADWREVSHRPKIAAPTTIRTVVERIAASQAARRRCAALAFDRCLGSSSGGGLGANSLTWVPRWIAYLHIDWRAGRAIAARNLTNVGN